MFVSIFDKNIRHCIGVGLLGVIFSTPVFADSLAPNQETPFDSSEYADITAGSSRVIVRKRAKPARSKGIAVDGFAFVPSLALSEYHDDNIFATESNKKSDWVTLISPGFGLHSKWSRHKLDVNGGAEISRYADFASENTQDYWLGLSGRYDFSVRQNVFGGINYSREHEDRASPDASLTGDTPTRYDNYTAHIGHAFVGGNYRTRIAYTINRLNFQNVTSPGGVIDNNDRDRTEQAIGLRYLYKSAATMALYIDGVVDKREYDISPDYLGNDRNSHGYRYALGLEYVGGATVLKTFAGVLGRNYQSALFQNRSAFDFGLNYSWRFSGLNQLNVRGGRHIEETTFDNSPGYLLTDASLRLQLGVSSTKAFHVVVAKSTADYYGIVRNDDYYDYSLGYSQKVLNNLQVSFDVRRSERNSNVAGGDFMINQVLLRISGVI